MDLKEITYGLIILIVPLILIIVLHRFYIYNKCHNNKECIKNKILFDIDTVNNKLVSNIHFLKSNEETSNIEQNQLNDTPPEEEIEGFFGGLSDWLYGKVGNADVSTQNLSSPTTNLNPSVDALQAANDTNNAMPQLNSKFPNENINDSSNQDLLNSINQKNDTIKKFTKEKLGNGNGIDKLKNMNAQLEKSIKGKTISNFSPEIINEPKMLKQENNPKIPESIKSSSKVKPSNLNESTNQEINKPNQKIIKNNTTSPMSMFKDCNFYSDKCPNGYNDFGSIGLTGLEKNVMLSCGNVENTKPAKAVAKIKNNALEEVIVLDKGHGFNPDKPPKIEVVGGKGNGAHCEAIIDDDGFLKIIKVIHPGNYYTETPNIIIEAPMMNSNCHFCCKMN